jgi:hypothetical protein
VVRRLQTRVTLVARRARYDKFLDNFLDDSVQGPVDLSHSPAIPPQYRPEVERGPIGMLLSQVPVEAL